MHAVLHAGRQGKTAKEHNHMSRFNSCRL